jgi:hypothetical protein
VTFSSRVIPKVSLTQLLIPRVAVIQIKRKRLWAVYIPYGKSASEKFKCIENHYNIRAIFKTKHTLRSSLMKTRPEREPQQMARCIYSIPCECGRSYSGKTGRPLATQLSEHRHHLKEDVLEKSKLAQHAYEEGHRVGCDEATSFGN